jgi:hypothetical protein
MVNCTNERLRLQPQRYTAGTLNEVWVEFIIPELYSYLLSDHPSTKYLIHIAVLHGDNIRKLDYALNIHVTLCSVIGTTYNECVLVVQ